jgi:hypothetical protein
VASRDVVGDDRSDSNYEGNDLVSPEVESELPDVDPRDPTDSKGDRALDDLPEQWCDELDVVDDRWCSPGPSISPMLTVSTRSIGGAQTPPCSPEHEPPMPEIDVLALHTVESTDEHQFVLDGPATRIG